MQGGAASFSNEADRKRALEAARTAAQQQPGGGLEPGRLVETPEGHQAIVLSKGHGFYLLDLGDGQHIRKRGNELVPLPPAPERPRREALVSKGSLASPATPKAGGSTGVTAPAKRSEAGAGDHARPRPLQGARKIARSPAAPARITSRELATVLLLLAGTGAYGEAAAAATAPPSAELPDLLTMLDGTAVTSASGWAERRGELKALTQEHILGTLPPAGATKLLSATAINRTDGPALRSMYAEFLRQPLVELYGDCMVVLKFS